LRTSYNQLTGAQLTGLQATALVYSQALITGAPKFKSSSQLLAYRTGQILAQSTNGPGPVPSVVITNLQDLYRASIPACPPRQVIAEPISNTSIRVTWIGGNTGGFPILYYTVTVGGTSVRGVSPVIITGLAAATTYTVRVTATAEGGTSAPAVATVRTYGPPTPPQSVTAVGGDRQATISWLAPANTGGSVITGYSIKGYIGSSTSPFLTINSVGAGMTYVVTGLTNGTTYTFTVAAINQYGTSAVATAAPVIPLSVPDAPNAPLWVVGDRYIDLSWSAPYNGGSPITFYTIRTYTDGDLIDIKDVSGATSSTITGLINGTPYTFTATATNDVGTSLPSAPGGPVIPAGAPFIPTNVVATNTYSGSTFTGITVTWTAPANNGAAITNYYVYPFNGIYTLPYTDVGGGSTTTSISSNILLGTTYTFRVTAKNSAGTSDGSITSNSVVAAAAPVAPAAPLWVAGDGSVTLSWSAPYDNGSSITDYIINGYTSASIYPVYTNPTGNVTSFVVSPLTNGVPYTFTVTAKNNLGFSAPSAVSSPVTPAGVPNAPTNIIATSYGDRANIQWTVPADNGASIIEYVIYPYIPSQPFLLLPPIIFLIPDISYDYAGSAFVSTGYLTVGGYFYTFSMTARNSVGISELSTDSNTVIIL